MAADRTTDFGTKLREARDRKGVSLRAIADATKISVAVLEALERNDESRLPGGIFTRAFVRSYASEVGLDPDALQIVPVGVGSVNKGGRRIRSEGVLHMKRLDVIGFAALPPTAAKLLDNYVGGTLSLADLVAALQAGN